MADKTVASTEEGCVTYFDYYAIGMKYNNKYSRVYFSQMILQRGVLLSVRLGGITLKQKSM